MKVTKVETVGPRTLATVELTRDEYEQFRSHGLGLSVSVDHASGPDRSFVVTTDDRGQQDYGPRYAAEMWENAEALRRALERCHNFMRRCYKHHGPTGKPRWILTWPGLWGKGSVRHWEDLPCRACELEARENHDPGDEDRR